MASQLLSPNGHTSIYKDRWNIPLQRHPTPVTEYKKDSRTQKRKAVRESNPNACDVSKEARNLARRIKAFERLEQYGSDGVKRAIQGGAMKRPGSLQKN